MSFADVMGEIPSFSNEQLRALIDRAEGVEKARPVMTLPLRLHNIDGQFVIKSSRVIYQAEIERILAKFP